MFTYHSLGSDSSPISCFYQWCSTMVRSHRYLGFCSSDSETQGQNH